MPDNMDTSLIVVYYQEALTLNEDKRIYLQRAGQTVFLQLVRGKN